MNSEVSNKKFFDTIGVYVDNKIPLLFIECPGQKSCVLKLGTPHSGRLKMK